MNLRLESFDLSFLFFFCFWNGDTSPEGKNVCLGLYFLSEFLGIRESKILSTVNIIKQSYYEIVLETTCLEMLFQVMVRISDLFLSFVSK